MPTSLSQLIGQVGCAITGSVRWGIKPATDEKGVYVVSLHGDPDNEDGLSEAPISEVAVTTWIQRVPSLTLDSRRPKPIDMEQRLARYWLSDEVIVYIGKATSLRQRLRQYYSTPVGDRRPHAGGHWIKTLSNLSSLTIHYTLAPPCSPYVSLGIRGGSQQPFSPSFLNAGAIVLAAQNASRVA